VKPLKSGGGKGLLKVGGQRPILAPLHRNLEGHSSPSQPYSLFHPWGSPYTGRCI